MNDSEAYMFAEFCEEAAEYAAAEAFWDEFAADIVGRAAPSQEWRLLPKTRTTAGAPWTEDGSCTMLSLLNEKRARWVTLEQFAPSTGVTGVWASMEEFGDPHGGPLLERLRIDCVLSVRTDDVVKQLIAAFVVDDLHVKGMNELIARLGAERS